MWLVVSGLIRVKVIVRVMLLLDIGYDVMIVRVFTGFGIWYQWR